MKALLIAGHGKKRNGTFDPGACGYITKGENRYMSENFFPAMKKYVPPGVQATFHTAYNVYDYQNLATLARGYDAVIEFHYDAVHVPTAHGGHVIVYGGFKPDAMDLRLRDVIKKHIGLRTIYVHHGEVGISGRYNLQNVNIAAHSKINYRLLELGFGTNKSDAEKMLNNTDAYAKDIAGAIFGSVAKTPKPVEQPKVVYHNYPPGNYEVIANAGLYVRSKPDGTDTKYVLKKGTVFKAIKEIRSGVNGVWLQIGTNEFVSAQAWKNIYVKKTSDEPVKATNIIRVNDTVKITGNNYATGQVIPTWVKNGTHTVSRLDGNWALLGHPHGINSWVVTKDLVKTSTTPKFSSYLVRVRRNNLNIRADAGTNFKSYGYIKPGTYTIVAEKTGQGATKWGKLKSGAGWISLDYVDKLDK